MNEDISRVRAELKAGNEPGVGHPSKDPSGRMSTQNIVLTALRNQGKEKDFKNVYAGLHKILSSKEHRLIREGDTLFLIKILNKAVCHVQMINADTKIKTLKNILGFFNAIKKANYKEVHFDTANQQIVKFLENNNYQVKNTNNNSFMVEM